MWFTSKIVDVSVVTRMENDDHFKVQKMLGTYKESGTSMHVKSIGNGFVELKIKTMSGLLKSLKRDIALINLMGIKAEIGE